VRGEATQFAVAAVDQNEAGRAVLSDRSQPRQTGSLHGTHSLVSSSDFLSSFKNSPDS